MSYLLTTIFATKYGWWISAHLVGCISSFSCRQSTVQGPTTSMLVESSNHRLSSEAKTLQGLARNSEAMQGYLQLRAAAPRLFTGHWLKVGLTTGVP